METCRDCVYLVLAEVSECYAKDDITAWFECELHEKQVELAYVCECFERSKMR